VPAARTRPRPAAGVRRRRWLTGSGLAGLLVLAVVALAAHPAGGAIGGRRSVARATAAPAGCHRPAPTTADGYAALCAALDQHQWGGGDGAITVPLGDRSVWLFADTLSVGRFVH